MAGKGRAIALILAGVLVAGGVGAQSVLKTDMGSGRQIVETRKFLMNTLKDLLTDLNQRAKGIAPREAGIQASGIEAIARVLPPLFRDPHSAEYPVKGSDAYFKGASPADFEAASEKLRSAAEALRTASGKGDRGGMESAVGGIGPACGACHSAFRGKS